MKKYLCYLLSIFFLLQNAYANLTWTTSFGKSGSGNGEFNTPYGIRVHPITGEIWIADSGNSRLQIFNNDHSFSKVFDTTGHGDTKPVDVVFNPTGQMYVGDNTSGNIQIYNNSGSYLSSFNGNVQVRALTIDSSNQIYATSVNYPTSANYPTVKRYDSSGVFKDEFYNYGTRLSTGITIGPDDKIYYANANYHQIISRNNDLSGEDVVRIPNSSTWVNGIDHGFNNKIYIANTNGLSIIVMKEDGSLVQHLTSVTGQSFNKPLFIIGDKHGKFYVSDTDNNRVVILFDPTARTEAGTTILGTLNLTEDLTLKNGYHLKVQAMDDTTSGSTVQSDGKLTITNNKSLTANSGSSLEAASLSFDNGNLIMNQGSSLNMPITLNNVDNSFDMGSHTLSLSGVISGAGKLAKQGSGTLALSGTNTYSGGTDIKAGTVSTGSASALGGGDVTMADSTTLQASADLDLSKAITIAGTSTIDTQGNKVTSSGVISGAGKLAKQGSGTLALSGTNTYSGGTKLEAGIISLADNNALGTGSLDMADNTTLSLNNNISIVNNINLSNNNIINVPINYKASLQNLISNKASNLIKGGAGELLLGSRSNHQGTTEVNEGVLSLDNAFLGGDVTVASNARLRGMGHLLASLINNGTVSPGASPGIMQVSGNYIQDPEGVLEIYISPSESPIPGVDYSQLSVEGSANIAGSNLVVNAEDGNYSNGTRYNILTTAGGVNGEFGNLTLKISNGLYYSRLGYDVNNVFLELSRNYLPTHKLNSFRDIAIYINSLNDIQLSTGLAKALQPLYSMSYGQLDDSLKSMSPNRNLVSNYISNDVTNFIHYISNARLDMTQSRGLNNNSGNSNNLNFSNMGKISKALLDSPTRDNLINQVRSNLDNNLFRSDRHYAWVTPFGQFMNVDTSSKNYGYDAKVGGLAAGYDYKLSDSLMAGLAVGYYQSSFNHKDNQGSDNKIKSTFINLYGSKLVGKGYVNGSLVGSLNKNHLKREIHIGDDRYHTNSKHNSYIISPRVEIGYNMKENCNYQITPFAATEYTMEFNKSYNEKGASPLNMRIKSGRNDLMTSELGIKLRKAIRLENQEELALKAKLSYVNKHRSKSRNKIKAGFTEQASNYQSHNHNTSKHHISPGVGVELRKENGLKFGIDYNGEISKSRKNHEAMFQVGMEF